ncbi:hypothetical protein [Bacillus sp. 37MA]|uniref:hypothetical protein n=1 Tax=Bacillus sp. 37MA TaxID=1132442 RepID=UPI0012DD59FB|nr:hypothetical protein [Bacillus sp. 37MA]
MPENLHRAMAPFFNAAELYDMYGVLLRAKAPVDRSICVEDDEDAYIKAFKSAIYSYKLGKVRSLKSVLYVVWKAVTHGVKFRQSGLLSAMLEAME